VPSIRFLVTTGVIAILSVAATLWVLPSATEFANSNPSWNGMQVARSEFGMTPVSSLDLLPAQGRGTALVIIPAVPLSPASLDALKQYAEHGGVLIVMDNLGLGNPLLARLGIPARFNGQVLLDPLFNFRNRRLPKITELGAGPSAEGVASLVLNHPTVITNTAGMTVMARSSPVSFLDRNGNGRRDADEPTGPLVVAALQPIGAGSLVLVADSSLLLNGMLELGDNRRFIRNLLQMAGEGAQIYLDEAHLPRGPLDVAKNELARVRSVLGTTLITLATAAVVLAIPLALLWRSPWR